LLWIAAVLVAAVSNLDNLAAAIAFGIRGTRINGTANVMIAALTMAATAGAMTSGRALASLMPSSMPSVLGSLIIIGMGAATVVDSISALRAPSRRLLSAEHFRGRDISYREAFGIGIALSMNNLATGAGAGIAGIPPFATTLLAGAFSLLCLGGGSRLGRSLFRHVPRERAALIAGLVLVALGAVTLSGMR